jgi:hypothetical protein
MGREYNPMSPDEICQANSYVSAGLSIRVIDDGDKDEAPILLIEGSHEALVFLADVIRAVANGEDANTFALTPTGSGNFHFSPDATHGIYMQRTIACL